MFLNKIRNIFCVPDTKFVFATNVARAGKRGRICVGNNVSATMWPRLPGRSLNGKDLVKDRKTTINILRQCYSLLNSFMFENDPLYHKLVVFVSLKAMNDVWLTDIFAYFFAVTLKRHKYFVSNLVTSKNESIGNRIEILVLFFCVNYNWALGSRLVSSVHLNLKPSWKLPSTICLSLTSFKWSQFLPRWAQISSQDYWTVPLRRNFSNSLFLHFLNV